MKRFGKNFVPNIKNSLLLTVVLWATSCGFFNKPIEKHPVAKVYDVFLYAEDIPKKIYLQKNKEDSISAVHNYIENWAYKMLLIKQAQKNVDTAQINRLVQKYHEDLLTETYKNLLLQNYIDTLIPKDTLQAYYQKYAYYFKANQPILSVKYLVTRKDNVKKDMFKKWFFSGKNQYEDSLIKNTKTITKMNLSGKWFEIDKLKKEFRVFEHIPERYILKKSKKFVLTDSLSLYLMFINNLVLQNETLPLDFVQNDLKQLILSKRKQQGLKHLEKDIKQEAIKKRHFKIYKIATKNEQ